MIHVLDNPVWHAQQTGNKMLAEVHNTASVFKNDISAFAGLKEFADIDFENLRCLAGSNNSVLLFAPRELNIPSTWVIEQQLPINQMIYAGNLQPGTTVEIISELTAIDVPNMMELATLTKPGPFPPGTISFGHYEGIYIGARLAAMAGQRLQPGNYNEISAVCTHPDWAGRGYAALLMSRQINRVFQDEHTPFLHVFPENLVATSLYLKLGFKFRKQMMIYKLHQQQPG